MYFTIKQNTLYNISYFLPGRQARAGFCLIVNSAPAPSVTSRKTKLAASVAGKIPALTGDLSTGSWPAPEDTPQVLLSNPLRTLGPRPGCETRSSSYSATAACARVSAQPTLGTLPGIKVAATNIKFDRG